VASSDTVVPIIPGTAGGVACDGAVTGEKDAGPTLAGRPEKCLSEGSDISGGVAGAVARGYLSKLDARAEDSRALPVNWEVP
jgi:hypothetical protein